MTEASENRKCSKLVSVLETKVTENTESSGESAADVLEGAGEDIFAVKGSATAVATLHQTLH